MNDIILQEEMQLSKSKIWEMQKKYYQDMGIEAWLGAVPFFVTSNNFFVNQLAFLVCNFLLEAE